MTAFSRPFVRLAGLAAALSLMACSGGGSEEPVTPTEEPPPADTPEEAPPDTPAPAADEEPGIRRYEVPAALRTFVVELESAGDEPRHPLRYRLAAREVLAIQTTTDSVTIQPPPGLPPIPGMEDGITLPGSVSTGRFGPATVANGAMTYRWEPADSEMQGGDDAGQGVSQLAQGFSAAAGGDVMAGGIRTVDDRGMPTASVLRLREEPPASPTAEGTPEAAAAQFFEAMRNPESIAPAIEATLFTSTPILPAEPIGVGARWRVRVPEAPSPGGAPGNLGRPPTPPFAFQLVSRGDDGFVVRTEVQMDRMTIRMENDVGLDGFIRSGSGAMTINGLGGGPGVSVPLEVERVAAEDQAEETGETGEQ